MNTVVILRQVPDPVEELEVSESQTELDLEETSLIPNETDEQALEQALLLKETLGGEVTVVALDTGDVENMLLTAAAKGADRIIRVPFQRYGPTEVRAAAAALGQVVKALAPDLVMTGCTASNELDGSLAPLVARDLGMPYLGVVRRVEAIEGNGALRADKELPGATVARMKVRPPAVLGILAASEPIRYVPVSRIRAVAKTAKFEEQSADAPGGARAVDILRLRPPARGSRARLLEGTEEEVVQQIIEVLEAKGVLK